MSVGAELIGESEMLRAGDDLLDLIVARLLVAEASGDVQRKDFPAVVKNIVARARRIGALK